MNEPSSRPSEAGDMDMIRFSCPQCRSIVGVPASAAGRRTRCPRCQSVLDVPGRPPGAEMRDVGRAAPDTIQPAAELFRRICAEVGKLFVGQEELVLGTMIAVFTGGHVLIESVPGLGKTLFVRTLARALGCTFGRIQFTADLMPSDITGAPVFNGRTQEFVFRRGPVFTQLLLCDEINRAPAKTHAALLEIMQERNVTVDGVTHELEPPFIVMATQNPVESEGTYNLPEAQLDRFMFKLVAAYPGLEEETEIVRRHSTLRDLDQRLEEVGQVTTAAGIIAAGRSTEAVQVDERLIHYATRIVRATREWPTFHSGASPRAAISLVQAARTLAAFSGRGYAIPDDIAQLAAPVLRHRVRLTAEAEIEGNQVDTLIAEVVRSVAVPRLDP